MGWLFMNIQSKAELIQERIALQDNDDLKIETLAHCVRGRALWRVVEFTDKVNQKQSRYIACDLLDKSDYGWGYKDLDESMHPFYYSCPLKYLEMVPAVASEEWRNNVRQYHARRNRKLAVGQRLKLVNSSIPYVDLRSIKPLIGTYNGFAYRVAKKLIGEVISQ